MFGFPCIVTKERNTICVVRVCVLYNQWAYGKSVCNEVSINIQFISCYFKVYIS